MVEHPHKSLKPGSFTDNVQEEWACPQCALLNPLTANVCNACMMQKPRVIAASVPPAPSLDDEPEIVVGRNYEEEEEDQMENSKLDVVVPEPLEDEDQDGGLREPLLKTTDVDQPPAATTPTPFGDEEDPIKKKRRRRRRRRVRMVLGGVGGIIVGAVVFPGPGGPIFGIVAGAVSARQISKRRERKKDEMLARSAATVEASKPQENKPAMTNNNDPTTCELERSEAVMT